MRRFAFISRHEPTQAQLEIARKQEIDLVHIGDTDAFGDLTELRDKLNSENFTGVVVVHAWLALSLAGDYAVGVFQNSNRAPIGEKPQFEADSLHVTDYFFRLTNLVHKQAGDLWAYQRGEMS